MSENRHGASFAALAGGPFGATALRGVSFGAQMLSFGTILDHFEPRATQASKVLVLVHFGPFRDQGRPDAANDKFLYHFGPFRAKAAQMLQMGSLGRILDHFGHKAAQTFQLNSFGSILNHFSGFLSK